MAIHESHLPGGLSLVSIGSWLSAASLRRESTPLCFAAHRFRLVERPPLGHWADRGREVNSLLPECPSPLLEWSTPGPRNPRRTVAAVALITRRRSLQKGQPESTCSVDSPLQLCGFGGFPLRPDRPPVCLSSMGILRRQLQWIFKELVEFTGIDSHGRALRVTPNSLLQMPL
jgi:hypothetical protein